MKYSMSSFSINNLGSHNSQITVSNFCKKSLADLI
jgi:hypothetical protein